MISSTVRTELVEVPSFPLEDEGQGFDKLSPNGFSVFTFD
jgi:hypothetical protein